MRKLRAGQGNYYTFYLSEYLYIYIYQEIGSK